jgi:hypothetical protein
MAMRGRPPQHGSLSNRFDSKILNLVREFTQVHLDSTNPTKQPLGVSQLCNLIQERDIQLRRMKKKQLESSIQRAQSILRSEIVVSSEDDLLEDSDFEEMKDLNLVEVEDVNTLNKLITSQWTTSQSGVSTPIIQNGHQDDGTTGSNAQNVGHTPKVTKRKPANQGQSQSSLKRQKGNGSPLMSLTVSHGLESAYYCEPAGSRRH